MRHVMWLGDAEKLIVAERRVSVCQTEART